VKLAADELGVRSFGLQVLDLPAGFDGYPEHDHEQDGQEEVYIVLEGEAEFEIVGERTSAHPASMVRVEPAARRKVIAGPYGARILAIGCAMDGSYERPDGFRLAAQR
jgi:mannose-6-phosphate isomerase-like protein (cupin superfamily)